MPAPAPPMASASERRVAAGLARQHRKPVGSRAGRVAHSRSTISARENAAAPAISATMDAGRQVEKCSQQRGARHDGEAERQRAIGADPAVLHDFEAGLAGVAAAEAVRHIGEAVLVEGARQHSRDRQREQPAEQVGQRRRLASTRAAAGDGADERPHHREHHHRILQRRRVQRADEGNRQPRQETQRDKERRERPEAAPVFAARLKPVAHVA